MTVDIKVKEELTTTQGSFVISKDNGILLLCTGGDLSVKNKFNAVCVYSPNLSLIGVFDTNWEKTKYINFKGDINISI